MTHLYQINEHEVPLFPIRYVRAIFGGVTKRAIYNKEERNHLPEPNFRDERRRRLYSIEDLAIIEYTFKEVYTYSQGIGVPTWVKELIAEALAQSKKIVLQYGCSQSPNDWDEIANKYSKFDKYRLQIYIESWRRRLLEVDKFFPELVEDGEEYF